MPLRTTDPLPLQAMPEHRASPRRKLLKVALALLALFCLALVVYPRSFLHEMLFGEVPFSWSALLSMLSGYGYVLFLVYVAGISILLFLENRNPDRTLAWLLVLGLLPVVGLILYWVVGPNFRSLADKRRFRRARPRMEEAVFVGEHESPLVKDTMQLVYRCSGSHVEAAGGVRVFTNGRDAFGRIKERLAAARRGILLESYIIVNDRLGNEVREILEARAREGVAVCVLYDAVGSWRIGKDYLESLRGAGVTTYAFLPVALPMFRGANYRNHRKIIVVDGEYGFMGGMNIGDEYVEGNERFATWRDTHMELGGQAVESLRRLFLNDLAFCGAPDDVRTRMALASEPPRGADVGEQGEIPVQIIASGPDTAWDTIQKAYFSVIARARDKFWLTTPYLVPGDSLMEALCMASLSGVDVRILMPGKGDHALVHWASYNCCDDLLRAGVRIFLYDDTSFVHAKTFTCDGSILSVGSANLDTRSLHINFEVQAFLYDAGLARQGEDVFLRDMERSRELTFPEWRLRSPVQKVKESVGKLFSSLL